MTLPIQINVKHIGHVFSIHPRINQAIDELNLLIWNTLQGEDSWYRLGDNPYSFYVAYWAWDKTLRVRGIHGTFKDQEYEIKFVGENHFEFALPARKYVFSDDPAYGSFNISPDSSLFTGSGYFQELAVYDTKWAESNKDFSRNIKWLMTDEKQLEAATFILELCEVIRQRTAKDD